MSDLKLEALVRTENERPQELRRQDFIPAILYGHGVKNKVLKLPYAKFTKIYREAGTNTLIDLVVDQDKSVKVLIHEIDRHVESDKISHVDFYQVRMDEKIETDIPIHLLGESPAVKHFGGVLITQNSSLAVKCLPQDLINFIELDLSVLTELDTSLKVKDLNIPKNIEVLRGANEVVVSVNSPRKEEEEIKPVEVVAEGVDPAEGAAKPEGAGSGKPTK